VIVVQYGVMAYGQSLTGKQVAEVVDEESPTLNREGARELAQGFQRRGLAVVQTHVGGQSVDDLVAELERDPKIAIGEEPALPRLRRRHRP
jgi:hypothetical protein